METKEIIAGTLEWCNQMRKEQGKEPLVDLPKGQRYNTRSCPCGAATDLTVGVLSYAMPGTLMSYKELPEMVTEFISLFDSGQLPQYDIDHE